LDSGKVVNEVGGLTMSGFEKLRVGDVVVRMLAGTLPMKLQVSEITEQLIVCSAWLFDKATGAEIDEELGWGPPPLMTGSYIDPSKTEYGAQKQVAESGEPKRSACPTTARKR
jgi:hypothetical protein